MTRARRFRPHPSAAPAAGAAGPGASLLPQVRGVSPPSAVRPWDPWGLTPLPATARSEPGWPPQRALPLTTPASARSTAPARLPQPAGATAPPAAARGGGPHEPPGGPRRRPQRRAHREASEAARNPRDLPAPLGDGGRDTDGGNRGLCQLGASGSQKSLVPWSPQLLEVESRLQGTFGLTMDRLSSQLVSDDPPLHQELSNLSLNEHFDDLGARRFPQLGGLMFAAKQQRSQIRQTFGSHYDRHASPVRNTRSSGESYPSSSRSARRAAEAKERDAEFGRRWVSDMVGGIACSERHRAEDVKWRQLEVLFGEVPSWADHLPAGTRQEDLLPADVDKRTEAYNRQQTERENTVVYKHQFAREPPWMFSRDEVCLLLQVAELWSRATRGPRGSRGMDRPTFCRMLLDLGLVDQERVPFFWAAALFDSQARVLRIPCYGQGEVYVTQPMVSWKAFVIIMDVIVRQHFQPTDTRHFMSSLWSIAKFRLPAFVIEESGFVESHDVDAAGAMRRATCGWQPVDADPVSPRGRRVAGASKEPPSWHRARSPEHPMSDPEVLREKQVRDSLMQSLLVEPEVLHVIVQHQELFEAVHGAYSDSLGHMSYIMLHRFCVDFGVIPRLTTAQSLREVYVSTKSVHVFEEPEEDTGEAAVLEGFPMAERVASAAKAEAIMLPTPERRWNDPRTLPPKPWIRAVQLSKASASGAGSVPLAGPQGKRNSGRAISKRPVVDKAAAGQPDAPSPRPTSAPRGTPAGDGAPRLRDSPEAPPGARPRRNLRPEQEAGREDSKQPADLGAHCFGHGAFAEAMCRIAFAYLHFSGTAQQQSMGSLGRATWLIAYLRSSLQYFGRLGPERLLQRPRGCPLRSLLAAMPPEECGGCPREALAVDLPPATVRHGVGPDDAVVRATTRSLRRSSTSKTVDRSGGQRRPSALLSQVASETGAPPGGAPHAPPGVGVLDAVPPGLLSESGDDSDSSSSATSSCGQSGVDVEATFSMTISSAPRKRSMKVRAADTGGSLLLGAGRVDTHGKVRRPSRQLSIVALDSLSPWPPVGSAWIEDGVCRLCEADLSTTPWGRATCPGCSVVDVCRFQRHPFKPLLLDWHPDIPASKVVPQADEPPPTYQAIVQLPPMGKRAGLRGVPVPKMVAISAAFKQGGLEASQMPTTTSVHRGNISQPR